MAQREIERCVVGMKLAADVRDHNGRILLASGTTLEEKHFRVFKMWGIRNVPIEDSGETANAGDAAPAADPEKLRKMEEELDIIFRHTNRENPVIQSLYRLAMNKRMEGEAS
jgi:hypothetical protein